MKRGKTLLTVLECAFVVVFAAATIAMIAQIIREGRGKGSTFAERPDTTTVVEIKRLTIVEPEHVAATLLPDVIKRLPKIKAATDTIGESVFNEEANTDSADVIVPMEQKVYTDSANYRAVISGAWVTLDTMEVYPRREIVTIRTPPKRWSIGITAGYGYAGKWTPFVGVGVTYNLFQF